MARVNTEKMVKVSRNGKEYAFGKARKNEYGEWVVKVYINGEFSEDCTIYADSKEDAEATRDAEIARMSQKETKSEETMTEETKSNEVSFANDQIKIDTSNLTDLETKVMINARTNWYSDVLESDGEWVCALEEGTFSLNMKQIRGTIASLVKKGYMGVYKDRNPKDDTFYLTEAGKKLYSDYQG